MLAPLASLLAVTAIALAAYAVGMPIVVGLGLAGDDRSARSVWSIAVGLVVAGTALAGMGLIEGLYSSVIGVLTLVGCFVAAGPLLLCRRGSCHSAQAHKIGAGDTAQALESGTWAPPPRWLSAGIGALAGLACLGALVCAMAPTTAGDALCYHLELPKVFLAERSLSYLPYQDNSTFPLLVEMWYLWALALDGPVAAALVHWGLGLLLASATVVLAAPILGRPWARIAGAVVLLVPGIGNQMGVPLNDLGLAALTTLALAAWWRAAVNEEGGHWFVLAGLMAGGAMATKYLAMVFAAAVAVSWLWMLLRRSAQRRLLVRGAAVVGVVALSTSGIWYLRAAWHRGNPVYPFLSELAAQGDSTSGVRPTLPADKSPLGRWAAGLLAAPWQTTMHPERFGGRGHQLGVLPLAVLPGLLLARRLRGMGIVMALAIAYSVLWFLLRQNVRFLFPIVPLLAVMVVWVWIEMRRMPGLPRLVAAGCMGAVLAASAAAGLTRCRGELAVACGLQSREEYLAAREPTWVAADVSNRLFGSAGHLLTQDYRAFYFLCPVTRESIYRRESHLPYDHLIAHPAEFSRTLRNAGFTHLLLAENLSGRGIQYDSTLSRLADAQEAADGDRLSRLAEYRFRDADGGLRRYRLLMLR